MARMIDPMGLSKRQVRKVCESAGYKVLAIEQQGHIHLTVAHDNKIARVTLSLSPRSSFWPTWLLADISRAMRGGEQ